MWDLELLVVAIPMLLVVLYFLIPRIVTGRLRLSPDAEYEALRRAEADAEIAALARPLAVEVVRIEPDHND